jgi:hypothetical protein
MSKLRAKLSRNTDQFLTQLQRNKESDQRIYPLDVLGDPQFLNVLGHFKNYEITLHMNLFSSPPPPSSFFFRRSFFFNWLLESLSDLGLP